jgi:inorganic triphosphatase YgiF
MTVEREVKLAVTWAFQLPPLDSLVDGTTAVAQPRRQLEATYYDTADLRLIRAGVALRHRTGEPGPSWTVKLPGATSGQTVERPELTFTGPAAKVPVAALDLVRAYARGRALSPVATVHTARDPVEIRAPDGTVLAEVVDDAVTARVGSRVSRRFREIEVEAKGDGPTGGEVLTAALERIVRATGREETEQPVSKVVRALGARAMRPADVVVPELGGQGSLVMPHSRLLPAHDTAKGPRFGQCSGPKVPPRRSRWTVVASPQRS